MERTYVNMGRSGDKADAYIIHMYEPGRTLPVGIYFGYIKGNRVKLYPADYITKCRYPYHEISIFDLKMEVKRCTR